MGRKITQGGLVNVTLVTHDPERATCQAGGYCACSSNLME